MIDDILFIIFIAILFGVIILNVIDEKYVVSIMLIIVAIVNIVVRYKIENDSRGKY